MGPSPEPEPATQTAEQVTEIVVTPANVDEIVVKEQTTAPADHAADTETATSVTQPTVQEVKEIDNKAEDGPFVKSPMAEIPIQQLHIVTPKDDDVHKPISTPNSAPQTPRSAASLKGTSSEYFFLPHQLTDRASCPAPSPYTSHISQEKGYFSGIDQD